MKCSKCGAEYEGKFCPECGTPVEGERPVQNVIVNIPPQKKSKLPKIIGGVLVVFILVGIFGKSEKPKPTAAGTNAGSTNSSSQLSKEEVQTFGLGQSVEYGNVILTFSSITPSSGDQFSKPEAGKEFLYLEFVIENNTGKDLIVSPLTDFKVYIDDFSVEYSSSALIARPKSLDSLGGTISSGKKVKGVIEYEVSTAWKTVEIQYSDWLSNDEKIIFTAQNK